MLNGDPFRLEVRAERRDAGDAVTVTTEIGRTEARAQGETVPLAWCESAGPRSGTRVGQEATAGGRIDGEPGLRRRDAAPALAATVRAERARLGPGLGSVERLEGRVSGEASLRATDPTIAATRQSAAGGPELTLGGGTVRRSTVAAGRLTLERAALGTPSSVLIARGAIDPAERYLDLRIEARAEDFSLLGAAAPVLVRGRLRAPEVVVGRMAALPLFELGDTPPLDREVIENGAGTAEPPYRDVVREIPNLKMGSP